MLFIVSFYSKFMIPRRLHGICDISSDFLNNRLQRVLVVNDAFSDWYHAVKISRPGICFSPNAVS